MSRPRYTPKSKSDLRSIANYYSDKNAEFAERTIKSIRDQCRRLARFPGMGSPRDDLSSGLRTFPVGSYIVFFRPNEAGIEVVRVLHSSMKQPPEMFSDELE